jgi:hypothetical protein
VYAASLQFLGALSELRKATISFVISLCPPACPSCLFSLVRHAHGTTRLPQKGFLLNLALSIFRTPVDKIQVSFKIRQKLRNLYEDVCAFVILYL